MPPWTIWLQRARPHWPLLVGLLVGAYFRFYGLLPTFLHGDEAEYAIVAGYLSEDVQNLAYPRIEGFGPTPFVSQPPLVLYLFALASHVTGGIAQGSTLVSAVLGTATIALVYALGVRLRGRAAGGLAALFLAVIPTHVSVSRRAMLDAAFGFFFVLAILGFVLWNERHTTGRALLTGCAAAAAALSKLPGVFVFIPLLAGLAWAAASERRATAPEGEEDDPFALRPPSMMRRHATWAAAPVVVGGAAYVGLLLYLQSTQDLLFKLGWQASRVAGTAEVGAVSRPWDWYFTSRFGLPAQMGFLMLAFAIAGVALEVRRIRRHPKAAAARVAVLVWTFSFLAFLVISDRKEWFYVVPLLPAVALLAGLGADGARPVVTRLADRWARSRRRTGKAEEFAAPLALLGLVLLAGLAAALPFYANADGGAFRERRFGAGVREAALWIDTQDADAGQVGTTLGRYTLHLYNGHDTFHYYTSHEFVDDEIQAGRIRYVVHDTSLNLDYEDDWMNGLVTRHGGALARSFGPPGGSFTVEVFELKGAPTHAATGQTVQDPTRS